MGILWTASTDMVQAQQLVPESTSVTFRTSVLYSFTLPYRDAPTGHSIDQRLLRGIYAIESRPFVSVMSLADRSAYPVFYGSVPGAWVAAVLFGDNRSRNAAAELTGSWVVATGSSFLIKHLLRRQRPFRGETGIMARTGYVGARSIDQYSFPSGHAALASAIVTSAILSYPKWYVIAPGAAWVGSVSISRIWLGVHYPSDVAGGLVLGTAAGFVSSRLLGAVFN